MSEELAGELAGRISPYLEQLYPDQHEDVCRRLVAWRRRTPSACTVATWLRRPS